MPAEPDVPPLVAPPRARLRVALGAVVIVLLAGLGGAIVAGLLASRGGATVVGGTESASGGLTPTEGRGIQALVVVVHVLGAVARPGLYRLSEGARIVDAVAAAGGFTEDADRGALNLARVLGDAEQVLVPALGEAPAGAGGGPGIAPDGRVDLNVADAAALETLPRVGPAMAERIISWRERNGPFRAVEDLMQIPGIGERTFDAMREQVRV